MPFLVVAMQSGTTRISLEGDVDLFTIEGLRSELVGVARRRPVQVEIELACLRSINERGMQVLVSFVGGITRVGSRVTVLARRDPPLETFKAALINAILDASRPSK